MTLNHHEYAQRKTWPGDQGDHNNEQDPKEPGHSRLDLGLGVPVPFIKKDLTDNGSPMITGTRLRMDTNQTRGLVSQDLRNSIFIPQMDSRCSYSPMLNRSLN